jgi:antitoxin YefM
MDRETVVIHRRREEEVALVAAAELRSLQETPHLLRSPKKRGAPAALAGPRPEALRTPSSVADLRAETGVGEGA